MYYSVEKEQWRVIEEELNASNEHSDNKRGYKTNCFSSFLSKLFHFYAFSSE